MPTTTFVENRSIRTALLIASGALVSLLLAARPAHAQTTVSTFTLQASGTIPALQAGLPEAVTFSGPVVITATVVIHPEKARPPRVVVAVDGRGVKGTGTTTGTVYVNSLQYNLTRPLAARDTIQTTFAFFPDSPGAQLSSKTGVLNLKLTYDKAKMSLTSATGTVGSL
jgi:hypothetical protein